MTLYEKSDKIKYKYICILLQMQEIYLNYRKQVDEIMKAKWFSRIFAAVMVIASIAFSSSIPYLLLFNVSRRVRTTKITITPVKSD